MQRRLIAFTWVLLATAAGVSPQSAQAQSRDGRFPITTASVAAAVQGAGLAVTAAQLDVPALLTATTAAPTLRLSAVDLLADGRLRVRVACEHTGECLPFLVMVQGVEDPASGVATLRRALAATTELPNRGPLLQAGQHTTLIMQSDHMILSVPVIAIDSGRPGNAVRVSSTDRKQVFNGVVTNEQTVRGSLP